MSRVIIFGGVGFIGRNLVSYLVNNNLVSKVAVVDKAIPEVSGLSPEELQIFNCDKVIYKQANLARPSSVASAFELDGGSWEYAINLAASTKYSQVDEVYKENIEDVAKATSCGAKTAGVKRFIQVSTAQVYDSGKKNNDEKSKIKPWTNLAKSSYSAEGLVKESGVAHIIVRPAIVYGPGDIGGITPRLIAGAVYKKLGEKMELLWDKNLKINTVHVTDVVRALWFLTNHGDNGQIFNLADQADSDQGSITGIISKLFGVEADYMGSLKSSVFTKLSIKTVADTANEKHLQPWSKLLKECNIVNSPLTPYIDEELLYNHPTSINGNAICALGFEYSVPAPTLENLKELIVDIEKKGFFPKGLLSA